MSDDESSTEEGTFFTVIYHLTECGDYVLTVLDCGPDGIIIQCGEERIEIGRAATEMLRNILNKILSEKVE